MAENQPSATPQPGLSVTRRSGVFRREITLIWAIVFAFIAIGLNLSGILPYAVAAGLFPGANLFQFVLAAVSAALIFGIVYSAIGGLVPRDGADYVLTSRTLGGGVGFATSFASVVLLGLAAGAIIAMVPRLILPGLLTSLGLIQGGTAADLGQAIAQPATAIILGTGLVVLAFIMAIVPRRIIRWIMGITAFLTLAVWVWMVITLVGKTGIQFPPAWDAAMGIDNYVTRLSSALDQGMVLTKNPQLGMIAGFALALWLFFGSFSLISAAGEMKNPGRDLPISHLLSTLVAGGLVAAVVFLVRGLVLGSWYSAESFLFLQGSQDQAMPWVFFYASIFQKSDLIQSSLFFQVLLILTWVLGFLSLLQAMFFYASRTIWAWAQDRMVPQALAFIHPSWRCPLVATLVFAMITQLGVVVSIQIPRLLLSRAYIFPLMVLLAIPLLSIIVAAFKHNKWFIEARGLAGWRIGKFPFLTLFALIGLAYLGAAVYLLASGRLGLAFVTWGDVGLIAFLAITGLAWYSARRSWVQRSQQNLDETFQGLPTE